MVMVDFNTSMPRAIPLVATVIYLIHAQEAENWAEQARAQRPADTGMPYRMPVHRKRQILPAPGFACAWRIRSAFAIFPGRRICELAPQA
jgi:hypothetical protein